jgi:hypothetical protein
MQHHNLDGELPYSRDHWCAVMSWLSRTQNDFLLPSELGLILGSRAGQESRDAVITSDVQASVGKEPSTVDIVHPVIKQTQVKTAE